MAGSWDGEIYLGDATNESVVGGAGSEGIYTRGGNDTVVAGKGNDSVEGGEGSDSLDGGKGDDILDAHSVYEGGPGVDILLGGDGNDTLWFVRPTNAGSIADGGAGNFDLANLGSYNNRNSSTVHSFTLTQGGSYFTSGGVNGVFVTGVERISAHGGAGADSLTGGASADALFGYGGDDVLIGGGGKDTIDGGAGVQSIDGGSGDDSIAFDISAATTAFDLTAGGDLDLGAYGQALSVERFEDVRLGGGADAIAMGQLGGKVSVNGGADLVTGGRGADSVNAGAGADTVYGAGGNDDIDADYAENAPEQPGAGAADLINGGGGNDRLAGGYGADTLIGGSGDDVLTYYISYGAAVDTTLDQFEGGSGSDMLRIDALGSTVSTFEVILGATTLVKFGGSTVVSATAMESLYITVGGAGASTVIGGALADNVYLGDGDDFVSLGGGDDEVISGGGSDTIGTGAGADALLIDLGGADDANMGKGDDLIIIDTYSGATPAGGAAIYDGGEDYDTIQITETAGLTYSGGALGYSGRTATLLNYEKLVYVGSSASSSFTGTWRDDDVSMSSGADTVTAGAGDDTVEGGTGNDSLDGGDGVDWLDFSDQYTTSFVLALGGASPVSALGYNSSGVVTQTDTVANFENVIGSLSDDAITGDGGDNALRGSTGDDTLIGGGGADTLQGSSGADSLVGGDGADVLAGARERLTYEDGSPSPIPEAFADTLDGGAGIDTADYSTARSPVRVALNGAAFANVAEFGGAADQIRNIENVIGGDGDDWLVGDGLDNRLEGGIGADKLDGGLGADTVAGGAGIDTLVGGKGMDVFLFEAEALDADADMVVDFSVRDDVLHLSRAIFTEIALGQLDASAFYKSDIGAAHDADDRIIYETDTGILRYDSNGDAAGGVTVIATLDADLKLTEADVLVV
jgi:Ca2+-binding RTX toxin-like protein